LVSQSRNSDWKKACPKKHLHIRLTLDRTYIPSIEKGERNVSIRIIEKISKAIKIKISDPFDE
jgi:transcriptional regulator with XRE-family HTH domain